MNSTPAGPVSATSELPQVRTHRVERWYYIGMAVLVLVVSVVGFVPGIMDGERRPAPLTPFLAIHGLVCVAWLVLFVAQTILGATRRISLHRQLGVVAVVIAIAMIGLSYQSTIEMGRRGFDLSGDLGVTPETDPLFGMVFPLSDLAAFTVLVAAAIAYRRRSAIHKRLMLLANIGGLLPAPLTHLFGHFSPKLGPLVLLTTAVFVFSQVIYDRVTLRRFHPVSLGGAIAIIGWIILQVSVIGPSDWWHRFAGWLISSGST